MKRAFPPSRPLAHAFAAALAAGVAFALLSSVVMLFQHDGMPLAPRVLTNRACSDRPVDARRSACDAQWRAAAGTLRTASK